MLFNMTLKDITHVPIEHNLDRCAYEIVTVNVHSQFHLSAWYRLDSQQMVNLYNNKNYENNFITIIILDDDDPPPEQVNVLSEALNIIYKYYKKNL